MTRVLGRLGPALEERDFALLWFALLGMGLGTQMLEVAIGWQVYGLQHSALDLGLIGLAEFVPMFAARAAGRAPGRPVPAAGGVRASLALRRRWPRG